MADAIGPGSALICVSNAQNELSFSGTPEYNITIGALYTVDRLGHSMTGRVCPVDGCSEVGLILKDKPLWYGRGMMYCSNQFKPLNDGDTSLVDAEEEADDWEQVKVEARESVDA